MAGEEITDEVVKQTAAKLAGLSQIEPQLQNAEKQT